MLELEVFLEDVLFTVLLPGMYLVTVVIHIQLLYAVRCTALII